MFTASILLQGMTLNYIRLVVLKRKVTLLPSTGCSVNFISLLNHIPSLFANSNK